MKQIFKIVIILFILISFPTASATLTANSSYPLVINLSGYNITISTSTTFETLNTTATSLNFSINGSTFNISQTADMTISLLSCKNNVCSFTGSATSGTMRVTVKMNSTQIYVLKVDGETFSSSSTTNKPSFIYTGTWSSHTFQITQDVNVGGGGGGSGTIPVVTSTPQPYSQPYSPPQVISIPPSFGGTGNSVGINFSRLPSLPDLPPCSVNNIFACPMSKIAPLNWAALFSIVLLVSGSMMFIMKEKDFEINTLLCSVITISILVISNYLFGFNTFIFNLIFNTHEMSFGILSWAVWSFIGTTIYIRNT